MKKIFVLALIVMVGLVMASVVFAVPASKTLEFDGGPMGKVTFSGEVHAKAGNKCNSCHPGIFQMKKGTAKITKADHAPGKFCGTCHDGSKAFAQKGNCAKCHKK